MHADQRPFARRKPGASFNAYLVEVMTSEGHNMTTVVRLDPNIRISLVLMHGHVAITDGNGIILRTATSSANVY